MKQTIERWRAKYRYSILLLTELVRTDFKLRYQGSFLGYVWSLLRPLFMFAILYLIFGVVFNAGQDVPHYPVYLLLGILLWNYFAEVANGGITAVVGKGDLLRKLNFPKYIIILAGSASALINLLIGFVVLALFMIINHVELSWNSVMFIPILLELIIFSAGVAFLLSALYVKFRDINYIWEIVMQAAFYLTPILYPMSFVIDHSTKAAQLLLLNPMAQIIQDARHMLITSEAVTFEDLYVDGWYRLIPISFVLLFATLAALYFKRQSPTFAEDI